MGGLKRRITNTCQQLTSTLSRRRRSYVLVRKIVFVRRSRRKCLYRRLYPSRPKNCASFANDKIGRVSRFNDFIGRFSRATRPRPQKLANFIDRLTSHETAARRLYAVFEYAFYLHYSVNSPKTVTTTKLSLITIEVMLSKTTSYFQNNKHVNGKKVHVLDVNISVVIL